MRWQTSNDFEKKQAILKRLREMPAPDAIKRIKLERQPEKRKSKGNK